jgi:PleD family two-component response regulator
VAVPASDESLDDVIERADKALYQAKNEGRNCVRLATDGDAIRYRRERVRYWK